METLKIGNRTFAALPACSFGDYGGDGSVGLRTSVNCGNSSLIAWSLIRLIHGFRMARRNRTSTAHGLIARNRIFDGVSLIVLEGSYNSESAYLDIDCDEYQDIAASLENYPALNDEAVSEVELEWEDDAIVECCRDIGRELSSDYLTGDDEDRATLEDVWQELDAEKQAEIVRQGCGMATFRHQSNIRPATFPHDDVAPYVRAILQKNASLVRAVQTARWHADRSGHHRIRGPDPYPSIPECSDSTEYVRKFCELNHLKG